MRRLSNDSLSSFLSMDEILSYLGIQNKSRIENILFIMEKLSVPVSTSDKNIYIIKEKQILVFPNLPSINIEHALEHLPYRRLYKQICESTDVLYIKLLDDIGIDIRTHDFAGIPLLDDAKIKTKTNNTSLASIKSKYIDRLYFNLPYEQCINILSTHTHEDMDVDCAYETEDMHVVCYTESKTCKTIISACKTKMIVFGKIPIKNASHLHAALLRKNIHLSDWTNVTPYIVHTYIHTFPYSQTALETLQKNGYMDDAVYNMLDYNYIYKIFFEYNVYKYCEWVCHFVPRTNISMFWFVSTHTLLSTLKLTRYLYYVLNDSYMDKEHIWHTLNNIENIREIGIEEYLLQRTKNTNASFVFDFEEYWMLKSTHENIHLTECFSSTSSCIEYITHPIYNNTVVEYPLTAFARVINTISSKNRTKIWTNKLACLIGCKIPIHIVPCIFHPFFSFTNIQMLDNRYIYDKLVSCTTCPNIVHTFSYQEKYKKQKYKMLFPFVKHTRISGLIHEWAQHALTPLRILINQNVMDRSLHNMATCQSMDMLHIWDTKKYCQYILDLPDEIIPNVYIQYIDDIPNVPIENIYKILESERIGGDDDNDDEISSIKNSTKDSLIQYKNMIEQVYMLDVKCRLQILAHMRVHPECDPHELVKLLIDFESTKQSLHTSSIILITYPCVIYAFKQYYIKYYSASICTKLSSLPQLSVSLPYGTIFSFPVSYALDSLQCKIDTIEKLVCFVQQNFVYPRRIAHVLLTKGNFSNLYYEALEYSQHETGNSIYHMCKNERIALLFDCNTLAHVNGDSQTPLDVACTRRWSYAQIKYKNWMLREDCILINQYMSTFQQNIYKTRAIDHISVETIFVIIAFQWPSIVHIYTKVFQLYLGTLVPLILSCHEKNTLPLLKEVFHLSRSNLYTFLYNIKQKKTQPENQTQEKI
jgi:hypothetical protein